jgi:hypothetical protein
VNGRAAFACAQPDRKGSPLRKSAQFVKLVRVVVTIKDAKDFSDVVLKNAEHKKPAIALEFKFGRFKLN